MGLGAETPGTRGKTLLLVVAAAVIVPLALWQLFPRRDDRHAIRSRVLGETRHLLLRLPSGYEQGGERYPLLVLLDGGDQRQWSGDEPLYSRSKGDLANLEKEGIPPLVMVGIENRDRDHDITPVQRPDLYLGGGGAGAFLAFIETELIPFVESRWRIGPRRILYGESIGGLFVLYALVHGRQEFSDGIAVSPCVGVWPGGLAESFRSRPPLARSLFIVYGERDYPLVTRYVPAFIRASQPFFRPDLAFGMEVVPAAGHDPSRSLELGLRFIFAKRANR